LTQQQRWGSCIVVASILIVGAATLRPGPVPHSGAQMRICSTWESDKLLSDMILNVILFMPLGFGAGWLGIRPRFAIAAGALISATIELIQLWVIPYRDASVLDFLTNTSGTALGLLLAAGLTTIVRPAPRAASRLMLAGTLGWVMTFIGGGWALRPAPGNDPLWGQRTPELGGAPKYEGGLLSARLDGVELPSARIPRDGLLREQLRHSRIEIDAVVRPPRDSLTEGQAPIVRVADACGREILVLGSSATSLSFRYRMRATALGLDTPGFELPQPPLVPVAGNGEDRAATDTIIVRDRGGRVRLAYRAPGIDRTTEIRLHPGLWWSFFVPWDYSLGSRSHLWTSVWMGALLLPLGYWAASAIRARGGPSVILLSAAVIAASITVVPMLDGFPPATLIDWLASVAGALVGFAVASSRRAQWQ
jgi:hypothetical protein